MDKKIAKFKISPNWGSTVTIDEMVAEAKFCFSWTGYKGLRPRVVLKQPICGVDCFEIGYDRYGLIVESECVFSAIIGDAIIDSTKEICGFIESFLISEGASELFSNH